MIPMEEGTLPPPQDDNQPLLVSYYVSMMKSLCVLGKDIVLAKSAPSSHHNVTIIIEGSTDHHPSQVDSL